MAKSSAERQAAYRARRAGRDSSERRINTWVDADAYQLLETLSERYGLTKRRVIELLVSHEDGKLEELDAKGELLLDSYSEGDAKALLRNESISGELGKESSKGWRGDELLRNVTGKEVGAEGACPKLAGELLRNGEVGAERQLERQKTRGDCLAESKAPVSGDQYGFEF